jgi:hypothetical protein
VLEKYLLLAVASTVTFRFGSPFGTYNNTRTFVPRPLRCFLIGQPLGPEEGCEYCCQLPPNTVTDGTLYAFSEIYGSI